MQLMRTLPLFEHEEAHEDKAEVIRDIMEEVYFLNNIFFFKY